MTNMEIVHFRRRLALIASIATLSFFAGRAVAAPVVPGTGFHVAQCGDDLEDADWTWYPNGAKSSSNIDGRERLPAGLSKNDRWYESTYRGQPDIVRRIPTPEGGLPESNHSLLLRSFYTGPPGRPTHKMQQDDLLLNVDGRLGGYLSTRRVPSCLVRVFIPPFKHWEKRSGASFGFRADVTGPKSRYSREQEHYWPGMFIQFNRKADGYKKDSATILIRGDSNGHELAGPTITKPGWWTLGMSFTGDGVVHYYASEGVDKLTQKDHLTSQIPYGSPALAFHTFFFNVVNWDDGRRWSTPWIIDDPELYYLYPVARLNKGTVRR
jgi:hypothetical protein